MNVWELLLIFEIVLVAVVCTFVFVGWRRKARKVSQAHSPEHRLKIPNAWTETRHVKHGGSAEMMRMKDGNFIMLSVDLGTAKVLVGSQLDAIESFTELFSFPVNQSQKSRRQQRTAILNDLKQQLGFPASVSELRDKLQGFCPPAA
jgi:hypothetical protein